MLTCPLLVEAIEEEFVPMLVYNNRKGMDQDLLEKFGEPSWQAQVIRFLDPQGKDLIPRETGVSTLAGVASRMMEALRAARREVPGYLRMLVEETDTKNLRVCVLVAPSSWEGEEKLGRIAGVVRTGTGWIEGEEAVRLVYHRNRITLASLVQQARQLRCARKVYAPEMEDGWLERLPVRRLLDQFCPAPEANQKRKIGTWKALHQLKGLTEMQKTKIDSFLGVSEETALGFLSPRQLDALNREQGREEEKPTPSRTDPPKSEGANESK